MAIKFICTTTKTISSFTLGLYKNFNFDKFDYYAITSNRSTHSGIITYRWNVLTKINKLTDIYIPNALSIGPVYELANKRDYKDMCEINLIDDEENIRRKILIEKTLKETEKALIINNNRNFFFFH